MDLYVPKPSKPLLINEIFGPTFQGEGRQVGQRCFFVRTATCNLECKWCDTPQTWVYSERKVEKHSRIDVPFDIKAESHKMTVDEATHALWRLRPRMNDIIVFSGGEPLLQQTHLIEAIRNIRLEMNGQIRIAFETAGTIVPDPWFFMDNNQVHWNVSPKLSGSGNAPEKRINVEALTMFARHRADFKFVVTDEHDMLEVDETVWKFKIYPENVWIMPEGIDAESVLQNGKKLVDWTLDSGYNLTLRQHVLLHGDKRGV